MRSGQLRATNDDLIRELLADPKFDVRPDGTIWSAKKLGAWTLIGRRDKEGYIEIYYRGKRLKAHRIVYAKYKGRLADDLVVDHANTDPGCNNPDNLELCGQRKNCMYIARRRDRKADAKRSRQAA